MSTEHNGGYCTIKDKMILTREEAGRIAANKKGLRTYKCPHCPGYHITHSPTRRYARNRPGKAGPRKFRK